MLRPFDGKDVDALPEIANDFEVVRYMTRRFPHPYTDADAEAWISEVVKEARTLNFAIEVNGVLAGGIGLILGRGERTGIADVGYWLGRRFWGRGIATTCLKAMTEYAFNEIGVRRLQATVMFSNRASARVLEHVDFTLEGTLRAYFLDRTEAVQDSLMYARLR